MQGHPPERGGNYGGPPPQGTALSSSTQPRRRAGPTKGEQL